MSGVIDITGAFFDVRSGACADYVGTYTATVMDLGMGRVLHGTVVISLTDSGDCRVESNDVPNHDFNDRGSFATPVASVDGVYTLVAAPTPGATPTPLSLAYDNAIFLNGAKLDVLAAACYGVGADPLGRERIGCMDGNVWRYDPMSPLNGFGTDGNNAHTQPTGAYHYHGDPRAMYDPSGVVASGVIGFAADGFPIFGPFIQDEDVVRRVTSSYRLREGSRRADLPGQAANPNGTWPDEGYSGRFIEDYEYEAGSGDLDECNGMSIDGQYGYYVTETYPWVMGCFRGTPDESFRKRMGRP